MYQYLGGQLAYQCTYNANDAVDTEMYFFYDSYGKLTAIRYISGSKDHYYYVTTNSQGDVLGIYSASAVLLASYAYDAWGNCTVTYAHPNYTIAYDNPIRYRGYYFDSDTGLYYLQSRYYNPEIGRFLNADGSLNGNGDVTGFNMFAYCSNNPVIYSDPNGCGFFSKVIERISFNFKTSLSYWLSPLKAISASVGYGIGIGVEATAEYKGLSIGASAKDSDTTSIELTNGRIRAKHTTGQNNSVTIGSVYEVGGFEGYSHYFDDDNCRCGGLKGTFADRNSCVANEFSSSQSKTLGVSFGLYCGVGAEASLGLDLNAWLEEKHRIDNELREFNESWSWDE